MITELQMLLFPNALCCSLYERNCVCAVTKIFTKFLPANNFCQLLRVTRKRSCTFGMINRGRLDIATSPIAYFLPLRVRAFFHKTVRVCHVYCNFKIGFTLRITVIFGTLKDGSLIINTLASNICFSYRNIFQNGVDALPKIVDAFLLKSSNFHLVRIIR